MNKLETVFAPFVGRRLILGLASASLLCLPLGCNDDDTPGAEMGGTAGTETAGDGDGDGDGGNDEVGTTGDGDGDTGDGDGDTGDGDGDTGDGDGDTGDGDGDTGDGDGDTGDGDGDTGDGDGDPGDGDGDPGDGDGDGDGDANACLNPGGDCCPANPAADAVLSGTVFAPNGTVPVAGAVVYTSDVAPDPIPDTVYCASCLELTCGLQDYSETAPDGTFSVQAKAGDKYLIVQKGQFLRVTPITVDPGNTVLADALTELPGEWDPANGLYIPKIAVANGSYDRIEDALGKMGLADTMIGNQEERTVPGTESFDLWDNGLNPSTDGFVSQGTFAELVADPEALAQYHVIFVPCSTDTYVNSLSQQSIENIRAWVEAGGRWYVADWANEWLDNVFPEYQDFYNDGFGNDLSAYDSLANILDAGMLEWLQNIPAALQNINPLNDEPHPTLFDLPQIQTVDNWSGIQYPLPEILVDDGMGNQVNVGHKAWLEGPGGGGDIPVNEIHPLTITAQYGCGKLQFTSYHTAEFFDYVGLSPQELVLMYTILEIGVCQADLPAPQ